MNLDGTYFTTTIPFVEFNIQFQTNSLIYDKGYSTRQYMIYSLILLMKEEGLGYRRISKKLNQWGIKTHRGCEWFNTSVSSVLKRKHERDVMINEIRDQHYPSKISKMELKYYTFDYPVLTNSNNNISISILYHLETQNFQLNFLAFQC
jgi:hypothetical protein